MAPKKQCNIRLNEDTYKQLLRVKAELEDSLQRVVSFNEAVRALIRFREKVDVR